MNYLLTTFRFITKDRLDNNNLKVNEIKNPTNVALNSEKREI